MNARDVAQLAVILRQELLVALRATRVRVLFAAALMLALLASWSGTHRYKMDVHEREQLLAIAEQEWLRQDPKAPHPANHFGRWVIKPIEPLSIFDRGVEDFVGQRIVLDAHVKTPLVGGLGEEDPLRALLGGFDLAFVVAVLFPLLVIFAAHDTVCGEKERGTLRQVLSTPTSRAQFMAGKLLAQAAVAFVCFGVPVAVGLVLPCFLDVRFEAAAVVAILWMLATLGVYLMFFLCLSIAVSASTARSSNALAASLVVWLGLVFVVPRTAELIAAMVHPATPPLSLHRAQNQLTKDLAEHRAERYRAVLTALRKDHPTIPEDYGVQGHDGRRATPDPQWSVDPTGVFISEANAMINRHRDESLRKVAEAGQRQQSLARVLSCVSPTPVVMSAWSHLAGTDWEHHLWFEQAVHRYFEEFGGYFNRLWAQNIRELRDFSQAPRFRYEREAATISRTRARVPVSLLFAFVAAAAVAAMLQLKRYDAR